MTLGLIKVDCSTTDVKLNSGFALLSVNILGYIFILLYLFLKIIINSNYFAHKFCFSPTIFFLPYSFLVLIFKTQILLLISLILLEIILIIFLIFFADFSTNLIARSSYITLKLIFAK